MAFSILKRLKGGRFRRTSGADSTVRSGPPIQNHQKNVEHAGEGSVAEGAISGAVAESNPVVLGPFVIAALNELFERSDIGRDL